MFVIDFDGTLYNTHLFIEEIFRVLQTYGIPSDVAKETMITAIQVGDDLHYDYSYERHIATLVEKGFEFDEDVLFADLLAITEQHDFADEDAVEFLTRMKALGKPLTLLTAGNEEFQMMKVHSTTLASFFDTIKVVEGDKDQYVAGLSEEHICFINDKVGENESVKKRCPDVQVITKKNPHKIIGMRTSTFPLPTFDSLLEIAAYVEHTSK